MLNVTEGKGPKMDLFMLLRTTVSFVSFSNPDVRRDVRRPAAAGKWILYSKGRQRAPQPQEQYAANGKWNMKRSQNPHYSFVPWKLCAHEILSATRKCDFSKRYQVTAQRMPKENKPRPDADGGGTKRASYPHLCDNISTRSAGGCPALGGSVLETVEASSFDHRSRSHTCL